MQIVDPDCNSGDAVAPRLQARNRVGLGQAVLIWSNDHGAWLRPDGAETGYTRIISTAGRFSVQAAGFLCGTANQERADDNEPVLVMVPAPESVQAND